MVNLLGQRNDRGILRPQDLEIITMQNVFYGLSLCCLTVALSACGQTGALQLPSDPNYDHRAKYLLPSAQAVNPKPAVVQPRAEAMP